MQAGMFQTTGQRYKSSHLLNIKVISSNEYINGFSLHMLTNQINHDTKFLENGSSDYCVHCKNFSKNSILKRLIFVPFFTRLPTKQKERNQNFICSAPILTTEK